MGQISSANKDTNGYYTITFTGGMQPMSNMIRYKIPINTLNLLKKIGTNEQLKNQLAAEMTDDLQRNIDKNFKPTDIPKQNNITPEKMIFNIAAMMPSINNPMNLEYDASKPTYFFIVNDIKDPLKKEMISYFKMMYAVDANLSISFEEEKEPNINIPSNYQFEIDPCIPEISCVSSTILPTFNTTTLPTFNTTTLPTFNTTTLPTFNTTTLPTNYSTITPTYNITKLPTTNSIILPTTNSIILPTTNSNKYIMIGLLVVIGLLSYVLFKNKDYINKNILNLTKK
jgi:hypothetical protein